MTLICLGCDRLYNGPMSNGYCVICTIENFRNSGIFVTITDVVRMSKPVVDNPHLIVKLVQR